MAASSRGHGRSAARVLAAVRAGGERARGARDARRASEGDRAVGGGVPARRGARRQPRVRADGCARATDTGNNLQQPSNILYFNTMDGTNCVCSNGIKFRKMTTWRTTTFE